MYLLLQLPLDDTSESVQFVLNELSLYIAQYTEYDNLLSCN